LRIGNREKNVYQWVTTVAVSWPIHW